MTLTAVDEALLVAAYYRGNPLGERRWTAGNDQVVTLSLFYTGDITPEDCAERFRVRSYLSGLREADGRLTEPIRTRYLALIDLLRRRPDLIRGGGNLDLPADPTYTACQLADASLEFTRPLIPCFPTKPDFPNWPDRR